MSMHDVLNMEKIQWMFRYRDVAMKNCNLGGRHLMVRAFFFRCLFYCHTLFPSCLCACITRTAVLQNTREQHDNYSRARSLCY